MEEVRTWNRTNSCFIVSENFSLRMMWNLLKILIDLILYPVVVVYLIFCRILQCFGLKKVAFDYRNDLVLITGSGNGLGRELALVFAQAGASLALWDIDDDGKKFDLFNGISLRKVDFFNRKSRNAKSMFENFGSKKSISTSSNLQCWRHTIKECLWIRRTSSSRTRSSFDFDL